MFLLPPRGEKERIAIHLIPGVFLSNKWGDPQGTVTVSYATQDGSATAGADYVGASGVVTFLAGDTSETIAITVNNDTLFEPNETFRVVLSNAVGSIILDDNGIGTIVNDDPDPASPYVSISDASVVEPDGTGTARMVHTLTLSAIAPSDVVVSCSILSSSGTAMIGIDYTDDQPYYNTIPAGTLSLSVSYTILGDTLDEWDETVVIRIVNAKIGSDDFQIGEDIGNGTIIDNDPQSVLSIGDASMVEGDNGATTLAVPVTLTPKSGKNVTVSFSTSNVTAIAGVDFDGTPEGILIPAGFTRGICKVIINGDTAPESDETFIVHATVGVDEAAIGDGSETCAIINDDSGSIVYVKANATGANNGSSWTNAYVDLRSALSSASSGDVIWVAEGTYKPSSTGDKTASFNMVTAISMYGGFAGTETSLADRQWESHPTILSGDLNGDDATVGITDNTYHIVKGADRCLFDGFIVERGNATGESSTGNRTGGGMLNDSVSPIVRNCVFRNNSARNGGGIYWIIGNAVIENVRFETNNSDLFGTGSGLCLSSNVAHVSRCVFTDNQGLAQFGSALGIRTSDVQIINCLLYKNGTNDDPTTGGAISAESGNVAILNCTIADNKADTTAGGCYFYKNPALIANSIIWGNTAGSQSQLSIWYSRVTILSSIIEGSLTNSSYVGLAFGGSISDNWTGSVLHLDPLFVNVATGNYRLTASSPCVDSADPVYTPVNDLDNATRDAEPDMGAYEY